MSNSSKIKKLTHSLKIGNWKLKIKKLLYSLLTLLFIIGVFRFFFAGNAEAAWWAGDGTGSWTKRKQLTITNNSGDNLAANTTVAVTINAKDLTTAGKLQDDCDDLRVVYDNGSTQTELDRYISVAGNATCGASGAAKVHFPLQAALNNAASSTDYYIYYGNPQASAPTNPDNAFDIGSKDALLVCPFDGTTTCVNGSGAETPSTETGAIRYGGAKGALSFSGWSHGNSDNVSYSGGALDNLPNNDFTVEFWMNRRLNNSTDTPIAKRNGNNGWTFQLNSSGGGNIQYFCSSGSYAFNIPNSTTGFHQWEHIAFTWDASTTNSRLFVDGTEITLTDESFCLGGYADDSAQSLYIGRDGEVGQHWGGYIDEVRISDTVKYTNDFTPSTSPFVRDDFTLLLYHFDEIGDDPRNSGKAIDDSGNGYHGTIQNAQYVTGIVGLTDSSTDYGNVDGGNTYAGHEGIFIEEGTTNKITNPSFEHSTYNINWTLSGGSGSKETGALLSKFGSASYKVVLSDATDQNLYTSINAGNTNNHTLSAYVFRVGDWDEIAGTVNNNVAQLYWQGVAQSDTTYTYMGSGWWRLSYTAAGTASSQDYGVTVVEDSGTLYIDGVQLEETDYATTYTDGSLGTGYSWSSTENNSTSSRTKEDVQYATATNFNATSGSISFWFKPDWEGSTNRTHFLFTIFRTGATSENMIRIYKYGPSGGFHFEVCNNSANCYQASYDSSNFSRNNWYHFVGTWSSSTNNTMYINGAYIDDGGTNVAPSTLDTTAYIGVHKSGGGLGSYAGSVMSEFRAYDDALTATEVADLYYSGLVAHSEGIEVDAFDDDKGQNPVGIWHFDESYGSTASDSSIYGNHLTVSGASWETQSVGGRSQLERSLSFDGTDDYATRNADTDFNFGTDGFSIGGWFRHTSAISGTDTILARYDDAGYKVYMDSSGYICFGIDDDDTSFPEDTACTGATQGSYADSQWHHFEAVKDGTTSISIYIDGQLITENGSPTAAGSLNDNTDLWIGIDTDGSSNPWDGDIDELVIYPYARTADQVKADVLGASRSTTLGVKTEDWLTDGLVGYWKMDEASWDGTSNEVVDYSGNGHHGTSSCDGGCSVSTNGAGKYGRGLVFGGVDDFIDTYNITEMNNASVLTISAWMKRASSLAPVTIAKDDNVPNRTGINFYSNGNVYFNVAKGGSIWGYIPSNDTDWHHVVMIYDGTKTGNANRLKVYFDNDYQELSFTGTIPSTTANLSSNLVIGKSPSNSEYTNGSIDEVRIYNRALTEKEAQALYEWAPGPVAYYPLDENGSGEWWTVYDRSGQDESAFANIAQNAWVRGKFGSAIDFDGSNDYVNARSEPVLDDMPAITASAWVYPHGWGSNNQGNIWEKDGAGNSADGWYFNIDDSGRFEFRMDYDGANNLWARTGNSNVSLNNWQHLAVTWSGTSSSSSIKLYKNGVWIPTVGNTNGVGNREPDASNVAVIGGDTGGTVGFFEGVIDEARLYNYARTQEQIIQDMNAGHPAPGSPVGSPVGYWKFDEGYGDTANDSSPQGNDGNLAAGTTCPQSGDSACPSWTNDGKFGKALDFDYDASTDDFVDLGQSVDILGASELTFSAWVNLTSLPTGNTDQFHIIGRWDGLGSGNRVIAARITDSSTIRLLTSSDGSDESYSDVTVPTLSTSTWYHFVWVYESGNGSLYLNGEHRGSYSGLDSSLVTSSEATLTVGQDDDLFGDTDAVIDEIKIYNFALTADQVKTEYNFGSAQIFGSLSTASDGFTASNAAADAYCPPGQGSSCTAPIGEWLFDEKTGSSAQDTTGNGNTGTISGASYHHAEPCHDGACLSFNGTSDHVYCQEATCGGTTGSGLDMGTRDWTVEAWIKINTLPASNNQIVTKFGDTEDGWAIAINTNGRIYYTIRESGAIQPTDDGQVISLNEWTHIAIVFDRDGNGMRYVNGVNTGTNDSISSKNGLSVDGDMNFCIGARDITAGGDCENLYFDGLIDSVRVYDYVRTPAQIAWEYNRGAPVGWWKLDENQAGDGLTVYDSSGFGNNGVTEWGAGSGMDCTVSGKRNTACDFDGTDDQIDLGTNISLGTGDFTLSAWYIGTQNEGYIGIVGAAVNGSTGYSMNNHNGNLQSWINTDEDTGSTTINDNQWHHLVMIREGTNGYLYVDGLLDIGPFTTSGSDVDTAVNTRIANWSSDNTYAADGIIDDVRVYNYALTDEQIRNEYNSGSVRFGD